MHTVPGNKAKVSLSRVLCGIAYVLLAAGLTGAGWYAFTRLSAKKTSRIPGNDLQVSDGTTTCRMIIPEGQLTLRYPYRSAVGMGSPFRADVLWDEAIVLSDCSGPEQDWHLELDARPAIMGAEIEPGPNISQPLEERTRLRYQWTYTSESALSRHPAQFWLRLIIRSGDRTLERWDLLMREFQTEAVTFLGLTAPFVLAGALASVLAGALLMIIFGKPSGRRKSGKGQTTVQKR